MDDCFELGKQSYGSGEFAQSINWFMEALKRSVPSEGHEGHNLHGAFANDLSTSNINLLPLTTSFHQTVPTKEILQHLEWAQNINKTLLLVKEFIGGDTFDGLADEVSKMYETVEGNPKVEESFRNVKLKYEALCRSEIYNTNLFVMPNAPTSDHKCYFHYGDGHPYFQMGPMKEEVLSTSPLVLIFHDVVLDGEITILSDLAKPLVRKPVGNRNWILLHGYFKVTPFVLCSLRDQESLLHLEEQRYPTCEQAKQHGWKTKRTQSLRR